MVKERVVEFLKDSEGDYFITVEFKRRSLILPWRVKTWQRTYYGSSTVFSNVDNGYLAGTSLSHFLSASVKVWELQNKLGLVK